jgi:hypothetical protein
VHAVHTLRWYLRLYVHTASGLLGRLACRLLNCLLSCPVTRIVVRPPTRLARRTDNWSQGQAARNRTRRRVGCTFAHATG